MNFFSFATVGIEEIEVYLNKIKLLSTGPDLINLEMILLFCPKVLPMIVVVLILVYWK